MGKRVEVVLWEDFEAYKESIERRFAEIESELELYRSIIPGLEWLTIEQAVVFLSCERTTLWRLGRMGEIEFSSIGNRKRYRTASLKKYLNKRGVDNQEVSSRLKNIFQKCL